MSKWTEDYFWYCDKCGEIARSLETVEDKLLITDDMHPFHKNCGGLIYMLSPDKYNNWKTISEIEMLDDNERQKEVSLMRTYVKERCDNENEWRKRHEAFLAKCCPQCGAPPQIIEEISTIRRAFSVATWGLASNKIGKTKRCKRCGHMW